MGLVIVLFLSSVQDYLSDVVSVHGIIIHSNAKSPIVIHPLHMVLSVVSLHHLGWFILLYIYLVSEIVVVINPLSIGSH